MTRNTGWAIPFLFLVSVLAVPSNSIQLRISLDRTAFFVGEPLVLTLELRHSDDVEFILDRLRPENLQMAPFQVRDVKTEQTTLAQEHLLTVQIELVSYEVRAESWVVPSFNLYYVRKAKGVSGKGEDPVETLIVPPTAVVFRSALVSEELGAIRDKIEFADLGRLFWWSVAAGAAGSLVVLSMLGWWFFQRQKPDLQPDFDLAGLRSTVGTSLSDLDWTPGTSPVLLYEALARILREYAGASSPRSGLSLTPAEVQRSLQARGENAALAEEVSSLVALSDRVRYAPGGPQLADSERERVREAVLRLFPVQLRRRT